MITHEQPGHFLASLFLSPPRPHSGFHPLEIHCLVAGLGHSIKNCPLRPLFSAFRLQLQHLMDSFTSLSPPLP